MEPSHLSTVTCICQNGYTATAKARNYTYGQQTQERNWSQTSLNSSIMYIRLKLLMLG